MKFFTKEIEGILVNFFAIKSEVGWMATVNEKEYGDFITLTGVTHKGPVDANQRDQAFELLEKQATDTIKELLEIREEKKED